MSGNRKDDHVRLALAQTAGANDFDRVRFVHHALAAGAVDDVDLSTEVAGRRWAAPFFVNAMTGGSRATGETNRQLGEAAAAAGIPIASGSVRAALVDPEVADTFTVLRRANPRGVVIANLGGGARLDDARRAVDLLEADALQIHLNAAQELVMPEGDRDFRSWRDELAAVVDGVGVPVIVKEVGFGLSRETLALLAEIGVETADVSGRGGTDFATIERGRRSDAAFGFLTGWGQSTVECLLESADAPLTRLASGGVRHPLDVAIALALGARAVGVSGHFLRTVTEGGADALVAEFAEWSARLRDVFALLGARTLDDLARTDLVLDASLQSYAAARGIDVARLARRSSTNGKAAT